MKKLNNKGLSLVELIISVGLISVVIVFLYSLLSDLNDEIVNSDFAINNQITRFEIIEEVQNDFLDETILGIDVDNNSKSIIIEYKDKTYTTTITIEYDELDEDFSGDFITVKNKDGVTTKWQLDENCFISREIFTDSMTSLVTEPDDTLNGYIINILVYTTNDFNNASDNNTLDDITFSYVNY